MAASRKLTIVIAGDAKGGIAALDQLEKKTDGVGSKIQAFGGKMVDFGKKMSLAVTLPVVAASAAVFKMGADLNETLSKNAAVFDDHAKTVEKWADGAADNFGQSRRAALTAASDFGNMFVQLGIGQEQAAQMSMAITELASDFASFHDAEISEVLEAQSAAFRGEYDSLQRFLPLISAATVEQRALALTGKELTSELTAQDKALAVNALMFEGAGDALGDFDKTAGSATNKQRILKANFDDMASTLGQKLIPIGEKLIGWLTQAVDWFTQLSPHTQNMILLAIGLAAAMGPLVTVGGALVSVLGLLVAHPVILAIAALTAGVIYAYTHWGWFRDAVDSVASFLKNTVWPIIQNVASVISNVFTAAVDGAGIAFEELRPIAEAVWNAIGPFIIRTAENVAAVIRGIVAAVEAVISVHQRASNLITGGGASPLYDMYQAEQSGGTSRPTQQKSAASGFAGTVRGPTHFLTGEGGEPEDVLIVPHSKGGIRMGGAGGGAGVMHVTIELGGSKVGEVLIPLLDEAIGKGHRSRHLVTK